jgi:hypothetical protein
VPSTSRQTLATSTPSASADALESFIAPPVRVWAS